MEPLRIDSNAGTHSLFLDCGTTTSDDTIRELRHEPNGYFWDGVARLLVETEAPELEGRFETDPEAQMFCAYAETREPLERLAELMAAAANDPARVRALIALADERGFEFDD